MGRRKRKLTRLQKIGRMGLLVLCMALVAAILTYHYRPDLFAAMGLGEGEPAGEEPEPEGEEPDPEESPRLNAPEPGEEHPQLDAPEPDPPVKKDLSLIHI